ncbi:LuxR C-terminal-related transcriptional regulator [Methylobacterium sp. A54F]
MLTHLNSITAFLADGHPLFIAGVRNALAATPDVCVAGVATSGHAAFSEIAGSPIDVAVVGCALADMSAVALIRRIAFETPATRCVMVSACDDLNLVQQALDAGARGFVTKRSAEECLIHAIHAVTSGGVYVDPAIASKMIRLRSMDRRGEPISLRGGHSLSNREEDILKQIAFGLSNKEIADKLGITVKSVETYKNRAATKLNLTTRAKIVRHALMSGWFREMPA